MLCGNLEKMKYVYMLNAVRSAVTRRPFVGGELLRLGRSRLPKPGSGIPQQLSVQVQRRGRHEKLHTSHGERGRCLAGIPQKIPHQRCVQVSSDPTAVAVVTGVVSDTDTATADLKAGHNRPSRLCDKTLF